MTENIHIPAVSPRVHYIANGEQTVFTYPFPVFEAANIKIWFETVAVTTGFSVKGVGQTQGGEIFFDTAPQDGTVITIERVLPVERITDFLEGGSFSAQSLNNELDYLTALIQQVGSEIGSVIRYPNTDDAVTAVLPGKSTRAGKALAFDANGNPTIANIGEVTPVPDFQAEGVGAIMRTMNDKAKDIVSIRDFGAVGDGITDDITAFQAALSSHESIYVPPGTYLISETLEIGQWQSLFGLGAASIIKTADNSYDNIVITSSYSSIFNLTLENGLSGIKCYGKSSPCNHNTIQNIVVNNAVTGIILDGYMDEQNPCEWNVFQNITVNEAILDGILLTVTGDGAAPKANKFNTIYISSAQNGITGHGVYAQYAAFNNSFIECDITVDGTAQAVFRVGDNASKVTIINLATASFNGVPNVKLDAGSQETTLTNVTASSNGDAILDLSGGDYLAFNAGSPDKNRFLKTAVTDLTVGLKRYDVETISLPSAGSFNADLSKSTVLVDATNGAILFNLPPVDNFSFGVTMIIKKVDNSGNVITISEASTGGPDGKSMILGVENDYVQLVCGAEQWHIVATNRTTSNVIFVEAVAGVMQIDLTYDFYMISSNAGQVTAQLPLASAPTSIGKIVTIKKSDISSNAILVAESGRVGPENAIQTLPSKFSSITVISNSYDWLILSKR